MGAVGTWAEGWAVAGATDDKRRANSCINDKLCSRNDAALDKTWPQSAKE
jgi:hypothetical protein